MTTLDHEVRESAGDELDRCLQTAAGAAQETAGSAAVIVNEDGHRVRRRPLPSPHTETGEDP